MKNNTHSEKAQGADAQAELQEIKGRTKAASASYTLRATWENIKKLHELGLWTDDEKQQLQELHKKAVQTWLQGSFQS